MSFFGLFGNGPYMAWAKKLNIPRGAATFKNATYQVVASEHGVPMVQLDLNYQRLDSRGQPISPFRQGGLLQGMSVYSDYHPSVANPDMRVALLMDRSGSMAESFRDGHVYNVCANVLSYLNSAGVGYDLVFYDDRVDFAGHITDQRALQQAINSHWARGSTYVTNALREIVGTPSTKKGIYIIVITDGEFNDKVQAQQYVMNELFPLLTPENPYAVRLHFVGAGEHVDREFLESLESMASGQGFQLVTSHHHAHLSHTHDSILDELDRAYMGIGNHYRIKELADASDANITRIGNITGRQWRDGSEGTFEFVPRHALIGLEFKPHHTPSTRVLISADASNNPIEADLTIPMPKQVAATSGVQGKSWKDLIFWSQTPEEKTAKDAMTQRIQDVHAAEMQRQTLDLVELARGGIPAEAKKRLQELGEAGPHLSLFTSNLAPDEIALLRRHGFKARGLVTGSAMYHVGQSYASTNDCEVRVLSDAYDRATELALSRMEQELIYLRAEGAVGVRLNLVRHEWGDKTIEVQAIGTAIQGPGPQAGRPWLSDLSGQEWYTLHRAGYDPAALVYGHCSWFSYTSAADEIIHRGWTNQEMTRWSDAMKHARDIAMNKVRILCRQAGGIGITGVRISRKLNEVRLTGPGEDPAYEREHHNLVMTIVGTAIKLRPDAPRTVAQTKYVLSLRDGRLKPLVVRQEADLTVE